MLRLSILPALLLSLPLIACSEAPSQPPGTKTVRAFGPGLQNDPPLVTIGQEDLERPGRDTVGDIINHSSAWPIVTVGRP